MKDAQKEDDWTKQDNYVHEMIQERIDNPKYSTPIKVTSWVAKTKKRRDSAPGKLGNSTMTSPSSSKLPSTPIPTSTQLPPPSVIPLRDTRPYESADTKRAQKLTDIEKLLKRHSEAATFFKNTRQSFHPTKFTTEGDQFQRDFEDAVKENGRDFIALWRKRREIDGNRYADLYSTGACLPNTSAPGIPQTMPIQSNQQGRDEIDTPSLPPSFED